MHISIFSVFLNLLILCVQTFKDFVHMNAVTLTPANRLKIIRLQECITANYSFMWNESIYYIPSVKLVKFKSLKTTKGNSTTEEYACGLIFKSRGKLKAPCCGIPQNLSEIIHVTCQCQKYQLNCFSGLH